MVERLKESREEFSESKPNHRFQERATAVANRTSRATSSRGSS